MSPGGASGDPYDLTSDQATESEVSLWTARFPAGFGSLR